MVDAELSASSLFGTWLTFFLFAALSLNDAFHLALPVVVLGKDWMPGVVDNWLVLPFFPMVEERGFNDSYLCRLGLNLYYTSTVL